MHAGTQTWQFSLRTLLIVVAVVAMWCGLFVALGVIGLLIAALLHGVEMAITGNRRGNRKLEWTGYALVALPLLVFFFGCYTVYHTRFSPDTFTFCSTVHLEFCGIRMTPEKSHEWSKPLIDYLRQEGYIEAVNPAHPRWDYVHGHMPGVVGMRGEAKDALRAFREEGMVDWSKSHPEHAKYLWPKVVQLTREQKYYIVDRAVREAEGFEGTTEELRSKIEFWEATWGQ
jgi:hypothetical protein